MFTTVSKFVLAAALVFGASVSNAQDTTTTTTSVEKMMIPQGTFEVSGGFNWLIQEGDDSISVAPRALYFFANNLALGGSVLYTKQGDDDAFGVGPEIKYYIPVSAKTAAYIGERILWDDSDDVNRADFRSTTSLGYNVFFSPTIAFGPSINYNFDLEDGDDGDNNDNFQVLGVFSIYL